MSHAFSQQTPVREGRSRARLPCAQHRWQSKSRRHSIVLQLWRSLSISSRASSPSPVRIGLGRCGQAVRNPAVDLRRRVGAVARARRRADRAGRARDRPYPGGRGVPSVRCRCAWTRRAGAGGGARGVGDLGAQLRIVAVATAAESVVPSLLRAFGRLHPEITLTLEVANRSTLFERVLEHEVDVGIAGRPPDDARIAGRAFLDNEIVLIAARDTRSAAARRCGWTNWPTSCG